MQRNRRNAALLGAAGFLVLAILGASWWASQKQLGVIVQSTSKPQKTLAQQAETYSSSFFSISIPAEMRLKSDTQSENQVALQQVLWAARNEQLLTPQADQLAITIGRLPSGGLQELSAVKAREKILKGYQKISLNEAPAGSIVYERQEGPSLEKTIFFYSNSLFASISVSGTNDRQDELSSLLKTTLTSWHWL